MYASNLRKAFLSLLAIGLILSFASVSLAKPITLKIGWTTAEGPTDPYAVTARQFKKAINEVAPKQFDVQFFPNRALGDEKEMLEGLSFGTIDMAVITNAPVASIVSAFQINDLPFLYSTDTQAFELMDGPVGNELKEQLKAKNIVALGFAASGFRQMINNVRPVYSPDDVKGIKWRVMKNPVFIGMFRSLGGNAVPMAWGEVFTAVQQGTIDGLEIPLAVILNNGYFEVCKYLSLTKHTYTGLWLLISKKKYDKLSDSQRTLLIEAAELAIKRERDLNAKHLKIMLDALNKKGMKVNKIKDPNAFRSKVGTVYDTFKPSIGPKLLDKALKQVQ